LSERRLWFFAIRINGRLTIRSTVGETNAEALDELYLTDFDEYQSVNAVGEKAWLKRKTNEQN
jgi:hypothetical protein